MLDGAANVVSYKLNPLPSVLGKKFGKDFPRVQKALREGAPADVRRWAEALLRGENIIVDARRADVRGDARRSSGAARSRRGLSPSPKTAAIWSRSTRR